MPNYFSLEKKYFYSFERKSRGPEMEPCGTSENNFVGFWKPFRFLSSSTEYGEHQTDKQRMKDGD